MRYDNLFKLKDKVAVVTGGAGLIVKELVRGLAEVGAIVVLAEIDAHKGKDAADKLARSGLNVVFRYVDIAKEQAVADLIKFIDRKYDRMDVWINNAYPNTEDWETDFEAIRLASWKRNVDMHLNGYFISCKMAAESMKKRRSGSIINLASIYGFLGPDFSIYKGTKMTAPAAYSVIKGGIINFTRYLASYYAKYNIRVNCISPGGVYNKQPEAFVKRYEKKVPLARMAKAGDIVGSAIYLSSDAAEYITGQNIIVDGGFSII